ncbi:glycosyltransferase family 2 protein [Alkalicoccus daliensis]|uniref:Glycosyltransferase involved in cell wall bisynthesis n=1 Tax=Alkalicoccus daliensis TaxID=745820 RepID=A0A1G9ZNA3_9BACI|nr:glycosyltransferase [Alkalicoccus daliensis]SDN22156.1 Glycosyltransferase involved in cell wall bisynthesis [Alkalicoccus daliensis]
MPKISVIALIYNLENYIALCINSVLDQTFTNFELILVNDGSTDNSGSICEDFASKDNRIRVIHKTNAGIAAARNTGISQSMGEYIAFIDCDDYYHERMLEILYEQMMEDNADIAVCDYEPTPEGMEIGRFNNINTITSTHLTSYEALAHLFDEKFTFVVPWNKLYKKEIFNNIKYPNGYLYDDEFTAHRVLDRAKKISYVHLPLYFYVLRKGSSTHSSMTVKKFDKVQALYDRLEFFISKNYVDLVKPALERFLTYFFWYYLQSQKDLPGAHEERKKLKKLYNDLFYIVYKNAAFKQKVIYTTFRISPVLHKRLFLRNAF